MRQVPRPYYHDLSNSEGDLGALSDEDEIDEEHEAEDESFCDSDDDGRCYVEEGGSDIRDDALDSLDFEDSIYNDERPLHGLLTSDSHNFHVDDKNTAGVPEFATNDGCIEFIRKAAAQETIPGLSSYMSALKENWKVAKDLALLLFLASLHRIFKKETAPAPI